MKAKKLYTIPLCVLTLFVIYRITKFQYQQTELDARYHPFDTSMDSDDDAIKGGHLPRGIMELNSDMELKPLWSTNSSSPKENDSNHQYLLAVPVGIKQKRSVDAIVSKFLPENFTVILFHYDGNVNGWNDLHWGGNVIHIAAHNQTKWWFAKRFLHPDVISPYDYIFLWDEDLGVENFHPGRYLEIIKSEGLEISQPALDPKLSEIHHRITVRKQKRTVHRKVYETHVSGKCSRPPCTGWVEGMAPVFSRPSWRCVWHLIQNDLIHGWGMDMKLGYCAQGDPTKNVGVVDSEFIVHRGVQTLGGASSEKRRKVTRGRVRPSKRIIPKGRQNAGLDARTEVRRRAKSELLSFQERWNEATKQDKDWVDPFVLSRRRQKNPSH